VFLATDPRLDELIALLARRTLMRQAASTRPAREPLEAELATIEARIREIVAARNASEASGTSTAEAKPR
jgi:hypothetical protein